MIRLVVGLFLIAVPVLELALLIKIGQWIGVWATVAIVITTAFTGILIISQQSFAVLRQSLEAMSEGRPPVIPVLNGLFLILAGALLLMPGLMTDVLALLLLIPPVRLAVARWSIRRILAWRMDFDADDEPARHARQGQRPENMGKGPVIEGEFERLDEAQVSSHRANGAAPPAQRRA